MGQTDTHVGQTDTHVGQTDTHMGQTDTHMGQTDRHTWPTENSFYARNFFVYAPIPGLGFFQTPGMHGESVHVQNRAINEGGRMNRT